MASHTSQTSGVFRTMIIGTGVNTLLDKSEKVKIKPEDVKNIQVVSKRKDLFEILSASVAPTIQGHRNIKKSILLQLLGGNEKNLENGTHLRGDINILLIGDPSTAKSQMLRHVMHLAPIAVCTTGRGSSGVGLTAAVCVDKETGERHLEAGAMVLADRGLVCIDEFDKMDDGDRVAIHEVMEQQTVTVAKAGIHASLNARCSVIAAANPIYGDYDRSLAAAKNIGLPDSLLSRFDLLFVVLDEKDPKVDKRIADRVIRNHSYKDGTGFSHYKMCQDDYLIEPEIVNDEDITKETQVYEKHNPILYGNIEHDILTNDFVKKYISYARQLPTPVLDQDATDFLTQSYKSLRQKGHEDEYANKKKLPITVRTLETLIRLSTAHSKMRLNNRGVVTIDDMQEALKLVNFAIFDEDDDEEGGDQEVEYQAKLANDLPEEQSESDEESKIASKKKSRKIVKKPKFEEEKVQVQRRNPKRMSDKRVDEEQELANLIDFSKSYKEDPEMNDKKRALYKLLCNQQNKGMFELKLSELWDTIVNDSKSSEVIKTKEEMMMALKSLENSNQVLMTDENTVALI